VGKEDANGYAATWNVTAYAICADPPANVTVQTGVTTPTDSQDVKSASVSCPAGTVVHDAMAAVHGGGASGLDNAPAGVAILKLYPGSRLDNVSVYAVETTPISGNWNLVAAAICGP
jgi:hypothetical protein